MGDEKKPEKEKGKKENPLLIPPPTPKSPEAVVTPMSLPPTAQGSSLPATTSARKAQAELGRQVGGKVSRPKDQRAQNVVNAPVMHGRTHPLVPGTPTETMRAELVAKVEEQRALRDRSGEKSVINAARDPMLAGIMDTESGNIFTAANQTVPPEKLHSIMRDRMVAQERMFDMYQELGDKRPDIAKMNPQQMQEFLKQNGVDQPAGGLDPAEQMRLLDERMKWKEKQLQARVKNWSSLPPERQAELRGEMVDGARGEIGTHGEFIALNAALLEREKKVGKDKLEPKDLQSFMLHNTYATAQEHGHPPGVMARCHHCAALTSGVTTTPVLAHADQHRNDPSKWQRATA